VQDIEIVESVSNIDLILGGHEHENIQVWRGANLTPIFKAGGNARSVYIHRLRYNTDTRDLDIQARLQPITNTITSDPEVSERIDYWVNQAYSGFREEGFDPEQVVAHIPTALDGRDERIANGSTNLTDLISKSMRSIDPESDLVIFNSGTLRIDDTVPPGPVTEYDVIRIIPFGDTVISLEVKGHLLRRILNQGRANKGSGGFNNTRALRSAWRGAGAPGFKSGRIGFRIVMEEK